MKFFSKNKNFFYLINFCLIFFYIFPGSLLGLVIYNDIKLQPQITSDFIISSNHFYAFMIISVIGFFTFIELKQIKFLIIYLVLLSVTLELLHLIIPHRSFEWTDLFGNLLGVIVVIFVNNLINKYGVFKK
tara:strand:- start:918 stop:1310 length:393 start_codon:yes stop_codon:yes gene_type:complete